MTHNTFAKLTSFRESHLLKKCWLRKSFVKFQVEHKTKSAKFSFPPVFTSALYVYKQTNWTGSGNDQTRHSVTADFAGSDSGTFPVCFYKTTSIVEQDSEAIYATTSTISIFKN